MSGQIEFIDTTTRDGNQSLWSATGLTTPDVLAIAPTMDRVGYHALDFTSSTHMAVSVRFHREDPWERIRLMSAAMPRTPLGIITTGMRFISWVPADEDVIRLAFRLVARNGIRRFQIADPSNDPERLKRLAAVARSEGAEEVVIGLTYSISDVHTHRYYAERAAAMSGCREMDRLYLKDPGGLLTVDAVRELAPAFIAAAGGRVAELHSHCTIGLAPQVYVEGAVAGFGVVHTASGPLSRGTSQPEAISVARNLQAAGYSHALDLESQGAVSAHFHELARAKGLPAGTPQEFDLAYYRHQLPGGMVSTTRRMLDEVRRPELFERVLEEVTRVRAEMGHPIIVTPVSQFIASQAARNVIDGERWVNVSDETVRYFLGHYGEPPAPVDPGVAERVLARPQATRLGELRPLSLEGARARFGRRISEEELLLRLTMPAEQVDAMIAARGRAGHAPSPSGEPERAPIVTPLREPERAPIVTPLREPERAPIVTLLRELARRPSISDFSLAADGDTVVWRRA
ncbi:MAG: biotin carboxyl carrier protein [Solirubrobacteraceae bacterium]